VDDLESSEESEDEKVIKTITMTELVSFLVNNFDLADYIRGGIHLTKTKITKRVVHFVKNFVVDG
jgi:hypothetical protein